MKLIYDLFIWIAEKITQRCWLYPPIPFRRDVLLSILHHYFINYLPITFSIKIDNIISISNTTQCFSKNPKVFESKASHKAVCHLSVVEDSQQPNQITFKTSNSKSHKIKKKDLVHQNFVFTSFPLVSRHNHQQLQQYAANTFMFWCFFYNLQMSHFTYKIFLFVFSYAGLFPLVLVVNGFNTNLALLFVTCTWINAYMYNYILHNFTQSVMMTSQGAWERERQIQAR